MDDTFQTYVNRVVRMTLPDSYKTQLQHIQPSPKYQITATGERQAVPFPGYTVITPPWEEESDNLSFYQNLKLCQEQLQKVLEPGLLVAVPPESFHLTLADLIWDAAYRHASTDPNFDQQLQSCIQQIFSQHRQRPEGSAPIRWQALGLVIMPRAIGVCLAPKDEASYESVVQLRRAIYQNSDLMALGIEQQYHLTAHVTLGYFGDVPINLEQEAVVTEFGNRLSELLYDLNQQWFVEEPQELQVRRAELRKFDDMTRYYRQPDWPVFEL